MVWIIASYVVAGIMTSAWLLFVVNKLKNSSASFTKYFYMLENKGAYKVLINVF